MTEPELTSKSIDLAAIEVAGQDNSWKPYLYEKSDGGLIVTGCETRVLLRGKNKGKLKYLTKHGRKTVFVKTQDIEKTKLLLSARLGSDL